MSVEMMTLVAFVAAIMLFIATLCMSVVLFIATIRLARLSLSMIAEYISSLMNNGERMLGQIDEQIMVLRRQLDAEDMFVDMEVGDVYEDGDED